MDLSFRFAFAFYHYNKKRVELDKFMADISKWPPKPEVVITFQRQQIATRLQVLNRGLSGWAIQRNCHFSPAISANTGSVNMAAKTGSSFNFSTATDSDAIPSAKPEFIGFGNPTQLSL